MPDRLRRAGEISCAELPLHGETANRDRFAGRSNDPERAPFMRAIEPVFQVGNREVRLAAETALQAILGHSV